MDIAVLSGKGGTGKTLVSVNLAAISPKSKYIDCDVEEPNGHLFFKPQDIIVENVSVKIPFVDEDKCNGCRICVDFCKFNALAYVSGKLKIFDDICHSCGGCVLICPMNALSEKDKVIGKIQRGSSDSVNVDTGILNTGQASGVPIIKKLLGRNKTKENIRFIDCPPGSSCIVMDSIKDADYCVLVAEPTVFGVHNLSMVYELVKLFNKPHGVVLNKCFDGLNPSEVFCNQNNIKILGKIYFDSELGTLNSNSKIVVNENDKYREMFLSILNNITKEVLDETASHT